MNIKPEWAQPLEIFREQLQHQRITQKRIDQIEMEWGDRLRPTGSNLEKFTIVDESGNPQDVFAPRWLAHLLGLPHRSVHVALVLPGGLMISQRRSPDKDDSPLALDIAIGEHVLGTEAPEDALWRGLQEEMNLTKPDLQTIDRVQIYSTYNEKPEQQFFNREWISLYIGRLSERAIAKVRFNDSEVVALYLSPVSEVQSLIKRGEPVASGLRNSLPYVLSWLVEQSEILYTGLC